VVVTPYVVALAPATGWQELPQRSHWYAYFRPFGDHVPALPVNVAPTVAAPLTAGSVETTGAEVFAACGFLASPDGVPRRMLAKSEMARTFRNTQWAYRPMHGRQTPSFE
jgi:hypothetical protein